MPLRWQSTQNGSESREPLPEDKSDETPVIDPDDFDCKPAAVELCGRTPQRRGFSG
jgi:hypothetical protein